MRALHRLRAGERGISSAESEVLVEVVEERASHCNLSRVVDCPNDGQISEFWAKQPSFRVQEHAMKLEILTSLDWYGTSQVIRRTGL